MISNQIVPNSLSCYIGRVISVDSNFISNGILIVDFYDVEGNEPPRPAYGQSGSTYDKVIASMTLRLAYSAWEEPPEISYKGTIVGKGSIKLSNALISNLNISFASGSINSPAGPCAPPFILSQGNSIGTFEIKDEASSEVNISTNDLEIKLTSDLKSQLPWCKNHNKEHFIVPGMKVLCMAFGNSKANLYAVDLFK